MGREDVKHKLEFGASFAEVVDFAASLPGSLAILLKSTPWLGRLRGPRLQSGPGCHLGVMFLLRLRGRLQGL